ncbi:pancreatic lipase-related protein 2-like [Hyperolius riggenbachi]|uniref:pancreatic lipase-related protein 2-like n=1 Tax=Hyperolius riggenbachi TaxID=752182 RepID=UPI0035A33DA5
MSCDGVGGFPSTILGNLSSTPYRFPAGGKRRPSEMPPAMKMLILLSALCVILEAAAGNDEVCYEHLGCFSNESPWQGTLQRPISKLPWPPEKINTQFFLLTRQNPKLHQKLNSTNLVSITKSSFQTSRKTVFIVHGMADKAENNWVSDMCQEILLAEDVNCIGVDWRRGSGSVKLYVQAANNARVVGAEIAYLLKRLLEELKYHPSNVHIIGHSLGAHAAGEAGRLLKEISRITGLDPARPYYENTPREVRLDDSDAVFVDVIHTDTDLFTGVGIRKPIGHFDFYPNGGRHMAGCPSKLAFIGNPDDMLEIVACNHFRSFHYYTYSVRHSDGFVSYPCNSYEDFTSGSCFPCPHGGCPTMGHYSDRSHNATSLPQTFYLNTGDSLLHFSSWRYKVSVTLMGDSKIFGSIYVSIFGPGGNVTDHELHSSRLIPGETYNEFIDAAAVLHPVNLMSLRWEASFFNVFRRRLGASRIVVQTGEDGTVSSFCANQTILDKVSLSLDSCRDLPVSNAT